MTDIATIELLRAGCAIATAGCIAHIAYNIYKKDEFDRTEMEVAKFSTLVSYAGALVFGFIGIPGTTKAIEWARVEDKMAICLNIKSDNETNNHQHVFLDTDNNPKTVEYAGKVENTPQNIAKWQNAGVSVGKSMNLGQWRQVVPTLERVD